MSSDGCQTVAWKGQAFSYLLHHPSDPTKSESYGQARELHEHQPQPATRRPAASGTWDGPAPRGFLATAEHGKTLAPTPQRSNVPTCARLRRHSMPMLCYNATAAPDVEGALQAGFTCFLVSAASPELSSMGSSLSKFAGDQNALFIACTIPADTQATSAAALIQSAAATLGIPCIQLVLVEYGDAAAATCAALEPLVEAGTVGDVGLAGATLEEALALLDQVAVKPAACLLELHPLHSQRKAVGQLLRRGIQAIARAPLGGPNGSELKQHSKVKEVAQDTSHSAAEVLLKWGTQRGTPVVVTAADVPSAEVKLEDFFQWRMQEEKHKVVLDALDQGKSFA